jgi:hypothetical protein
MENLTRSNKNYQLRLTIKNEKQNISINWD